MAFLKELLGAVSKKKTARKEGQLPNPYLEGNFAPVGREGDFPALEVSKGEIPKNLRGALYRMSPAPRFEPPNPMLYHWFDGDGMIDALWLEDGRAAHKNRWVRTTKLALEEHAGRALFGGIRDFVLSTPIEGFFALGLEPLDLVRMQVSGMLHKPPRDEDMRKVLKALDRSNTSIVKMAGRLLTLVEGSAAHEIDPATLETLGRFDFGGAIVQGRGGMVAHPKIDPDTGAIYTFGYSADRGRFVYHVIDAKGAPRIQREIGTSFPSMMHDFSVTKSRAVFYHLPAVLHMDDLKNPNTVRWEPSRGARIYVVSRDDAEANVRDYEIEPCYVYHPMNAFDDGNAVVLDIVRYPRLPLFDPGGENPNVRADEYPPGHLVRVRLDLETGKTSETVLDDTPCEFPVTDPRFAMKNYRYGYVAARRGAICRRGIMNAIGRVDHEKGAVEYRVFGRSSYTSEPIFAPKHENAAEGEGYLLCVIYHAEEDRSELWILDAQNIQADPIAIVKLQQRVPYGFHGTWVPAA